METAIRMAKRIILVAVGVLAGSPMAPSLASSGWRLLDDFEGRQDLQWSAESGPAAGVAVRSGAAHSGRRALAVTLSRQTPTMVRATWQAETSGLRFSEETRVRFWVRGNRLAQKPHGGLILVEAGGRKGGGDAHWMASIPCEVYSRERWQQVTLPPFREYAQPAWSEDSDGRLDTARIRALLFVAQQEADPSLTRPFTFLFDDVEATDVSEATPVVAPASNDTRPERIRPRLRGFVGRDRAHPSQVTFSDLSGWEVHQCGGMEATCVRSEEEPLFERYTARLTYRSRDGGGWIALRPKEPIPLPPTFNAVQLWVFGNNWAWVPDPSTPPVEIAITLRDRSGQNHRLVLGRVDWKFWGLLHKRILDSAARDPGHMAWGGDRNGDIEAPALFTGIEVRNCGNREPRTIYLDSVAFYQEEAPVVHYQPIPTRLPFPTTPDTILPSVMQPTTNEVQRDGKAFLFVCRSGNENLVYRYEPRTGTLSDLRCVSGEVSFAPAEGAGPAWEVAGEVVPPTDSRLRRRLLMARQEEGRVVTEWEWALGRRRVRFTLTLQARGKSLIHEWRCRGTALAALQLGHASGLKNGKVMRVPYYTVMGPGGAGILYNQGLFASHLIDWYVTECSTLFGGVQEVSPQEVGFAGGAAYSPLTNGKRNPLYERCFLTVSRRFEEVLPNIPNPPTPMTEVLRNTLYTHLGGTAPDRFRVWLKQLQEYRRYGVDSLLVTQHEDSWTEGADVGQGPQEYTMTLEGPPDVGGDAAMREYYDAVKALGFWVGPYNNYTDYSPLGKSWAEENVTRLPSGEWQRVWPPCYGIRPLKAAEMAAYYAPAQVCKFGVNTTYCDVHTAVPPWGNVDYEAGHPGAGKMRTTFEAYGRILMLQRQAYGGPAFSEGIHHCFYAGLIDGSYAQMGLPDPPSQPLLLDFDLLKLHPLSADISMLPGPYWSDNEYHCMAATIAYGHIGFFPFSDVAQSCRYFYLMQGMQRQYVQVPVKEIAYWDGREFLDTSRALPAGANQRGQVRVCYANGLEVLVNYNATERWSVTVAGSTFNLGPYGWVARNGEDFLEYSTDVDGRRVSFVQSPQFVFADAGGRMHDFGPVATDGEVVLKYDGPTGKRLIHIASATEVRLAGSYQRVTPRAKDGRLQRTKALDRDERGRARLAMLPGALDYLLE